MRQWTDQPAYIDDGEVLLYTSIGNGLSVQITKYLDLAGDAAFAVSAGNLFGSATRTYTTLEEALRELNKKIARL